MFQFIRHANSFIPAFVMFVPYWVHEQFKIMRGRTSFLGKKNMQIYYLVAITLKRYCVICPQGTASSLRSNQFTGLTFFLLLSLTPFLSCPLPYFLPLQYIQYLKLVNIPNSPVLYFLSNNLVRSIGLKEREWLSQG